MLRIRNRGPLVLLVALALIFTACASDDDAEETTPAATEAPTTTQAPATTAAPTTTAAPATTAAPTTTEAMVDMTPETPNIRVMPATLAQFLPLYVAQEEGFFAHYGLAPEILAFEGGAGRATEAALSGEAHMGYTSWPLAFSLAERGQQLKFVTTHAYYAIVDGVDYSTHRLIVTEDSPIQTVADLEGARIGVIARGSNEEAFLTSIMLQVGVDPDSVELIEAFWGAHPDLLTSGEIDVGYMIYPFITGIIPYGQTEGNGFRSIGDPYIGGENGIPEMLGDLGAGMFPMAASPEFVAENPNTIRAWALAIRDASQWIVDNPAEALEISVAISGVPAEAQRSNPPHMYVTWPESIVDQMQRVADMMVEADLLGEGLDVGAFISDLPFTEEEMIENGRFFPWDPSQLP